ncbi:MAG: anaerobic C4-dicarboxylate transporter family protein [Phycisphaerales bacterium]
MIWLELLVVLAAIFVGARVGGAGLGTVAVIGLAVLVFVFGLPPSLPPVTVLAIIVAVVTAAASMQAASGMDFLVTVADRLLRANPRAIIFVGPLVSYIFTFCAGTGHVAYSILPVIAEVSRKAGIRPERPMSISVIASQTAITASPLSAATAGMLALLDPKGVKLSQILLVSVPATIVGVLIGAISVIRMGKELKDDPIYQQRLASGQVEEPKPLPRLEGVARRNAIGSVTVFLIAAVGVVIFGMFEHLRPSYPKGGDDGEMVSVSMSQIIQMLMYSASAIMMLFFGAKPVAAVKSSVGAAGVVAVVSIVGLGWMGNCFFEGNADVIKSALADTVTKFPWLFAVALFFLSVLLFSQASTVAALMPVGIALGIPAAALIAYFPAVNGYFFLPTYATIVAAVAFDQTGTTRIGKYVLNHSFMRPGLVTIITAILVGRLISFVVF